MSVTHQLEFYDHGFIFVSVPRQPFPLFHQQGQPDCMLTPADLLNDPLAIRNRATQLISSGNFSAAHDLLQSGKMNYPYDAKIRNNLGQLYAITSRPAEARSELLEVIAIDPSISVAWLTLLRLAISNQEFADAIILIERAKKEGLNEIMLLPYRLSILNHQGMHSLAYILAEQSRTELADNEAFLIELLEALAHLDLADYGIQLANDYLEKYPHSIDVKLQLALLLQQVGKPEEGLDILNMLTPSEPLHALNIAQAQVTMYEDCGKIDLAIKSAQTCFNHNHDVARNAHLLFSLHASNCEWVSAWKYNDHRWLSLSRPDYSAANVLPEWIPGDSGARVYVYSEQGLGDQVFAYKLLSLMIHVETTDNLFFFEVTPKLCQILPSNEKIMVVPTKNRAIKGPSNYTHHISMYKLIERILLRYEMSYLFRDSHVHELVASQVRKAILTNISTKTKVSDSTLGLAWRSANPQIGHEQSFNLDEMLDLLFKNGIDAGLSLQYHLTATEYELIQNHPCHLDLPGVDLYSDLCSTARLVSSLSNVFTVSTFIAHLSGLLQVPTNLFISPGRPKLWYWNLTNGEHSLIYPSIVINEKKRRIDSFIPLINSALSKLR